MDDGETKEVTWAMEPLAIQSMRQRAIRDERAARGLCIRCGEAAPVPGCVTCNACLDRRRRQRAGKCDPNPLPREGGTRQRERINQPWVVTQWLLRDLLYVHGRWLRCADCGQAFAVGETVRWELRRGRRELVHVGCGEQGEDG